MRVVVLVLSSILVIVFDGGPAPVLSDSPSKRVQVLNGSPYVHLQHGLYFGKTLQTYTNRKYHAFLGIRYAVTPRRYEVVKRGNDSLPVFLFAHIKIRGRKECLE